MFSYCCTLYFCIAAGYYARHLCHYKWMFASTYKIYYRCHTSSCLCIHSYRKQRRVYMGLVMGCPNTVGIQGDSLPHMLTVFIRIWILKFKHHVFKYSIFLYQKNNPIDTTFLFWTEWKIFIGYTIMHQYMVFCVQSPLETVKFFNHPFRDWFLTAYYWI